MSNTLKNGMVSLKKSMTLGGTRNVAMTAVGQVLATNAANPTRPKSTPPVNILSRSTRNIAARGNYWGLAGQTTSGTHLTSCYRTGPVGTLLTRAPFFRLCSLAIDAPELMLVSDFSQTWLMWKRNDDHDDTKKWRWKQPKYYGKVKVNVKTKTTKFKRIFWNMGEVLIGPKLLHCKACEATASSKLVSIPVINIISTAERCS